MREPSQYLDNLSSNFAVNKEYRRNGDYIMTAKTSEASQLDILIVEDNTMLNQIMSLQVTVAGYSVRSARSGKQALKMIKESVPMVLILHVGLPDMTGQDLITELRRDPLTCSLPLIVHSTLDLSDDEKAQLKLGPSRFLTKTTAFSEQLAQTIIEVMH